MWCWSLAEKALDRMWHVEANTSVCSSACLHPLALSQIKCDQYWPSRGTETYGMTQVTLLDTIELATFCVRTFSLHKVGGFLCSPFTMSQTRYVFVLCFFWYTTKIIHLTKSCNLICSQNIFLSCFKGGLLWKIDFLALNHILIHRVLLWLIPASLRNPWIPCGAV